MCLLIFYGNEHPLKTHNLNYLNYLNYLKTQNKIHKMFLLNAERKMYESPKIPQEVKSLKNLINKTSSTLSLIKFINTKIEINDINQEAKLLKELDHNLSPDTILLKLTKFESRLDDIRNKILKIIPQDKKRKKEIFLLLSNTRMTINELKYNAEKSINTKSFLEKFYLITTSFASLVIPASLLGSYLLFKHLHQFNANDFFNDVVTSFSSMLLIVPVIFILLVTQFGFPLIYIYDNSYRKKAAATGFHVSFSAMVFIFSIIGYIIFSSKSSMLSTIFSFIFPCYAAGVWLLFVVLSRVAYHAIIKTKYFYIKYAMPFILPMVWLLSNFLSVSVMEEFGYSINSPNFETIFSSIGFSKADPSWYEISKNYIERTGLSDEKLLKIQEKFSNKESEIYKLKDDKSFYLYGKIIAETNTIQIICSVAKQTPKSKQTCEKFNQGDLIDTTLWLSEE